MTNQSFTEALVETVRNYRDRAAQAGLRTLCISIDIEGRVDGDFKIAYEVREKYETSVKGNTLEDVFKEMLRRKGWQELHQPLCLPNVDGGDIAGDFIELRE